MEWADMKTSPWEWDNLVLFYGNNCKIKEEHAAVNHHEASGPRNGKSSCDDLRGTRTSARSDDNHGLEQHQKPTENDGDVVTVAVAAGSADSVIGLKLGKRTYFEDTGGVKPISSTPVPISSTPVPAKKQRSLMQPNQIPRCQVEGCRADLTLAKDYHRRHKVCEMHSKSAKVTVAAIEQRFCQQCSRFHVLSEFDEGKRSCRRRLDGHNKRRRKPQPDAMALNHSRFSSTFYEDRRLGSILMDRSSFLHPRIASGSVLADPIDFKLGHGKGTWPRVVKVEDQLSVDGELHLSASDRQPYESALTRHNAEKLLLFLQSSKTAPGEVLNQGIHQYVPSSGGHVDQALTLSSSSRTGLSGIDVASATHGLSGVSDSGCALSLLSSQSWSSSAPGTASFDIATQGVTMDQLIHDDQHLMAQPLVQGVQHNFADKLLTLRSQSSTSLIPNGFTSAAVNSISKEQHGEPIVSTLNGIGNFEGHVFGLMQGNNFSGSQAVNSRDIQCTIDLMCRSTQAQTDECQSQPGIGNQGSRQFTDFQSLRSYESSIYDSQQML